MKHILFLLSFFLISSIGLNAQQDSTENRKNDSLTIIFTNPILWDSIYYPPCIIPFENKANHSAFITVLHSDSGCHPKGARKDLKNGEALIWFPGGFVGCDFSSEADQEFQNRYQVRFVSPGCCRWGDEDPEGYNEVIFQHLDKKYGKGWRDELRHDAKGFTAPKTSNAAKDISLNNSPLAMQLANPQGIESQSTNPEMETSVWWYILPTSGFALLLGLYFIKRKKD